MATRNIVPRADGEGSLGISVKKWGAVYTDALTVNGTATGVTPTAGDDSTKLATTAYVQAELADYVTLNGLSTELADYVTLNGLSTELADYVTLNGLSTELGDYLPLAGGTMTGAIVGNPLTLTADDGNDSANLVLNPSGSATWNGKEVERVNSKSLGGNDGYIRFESGFQVCWGVASTASDNIGSVTFPAPFNTVPRIVGSAIGDTAQDRSFLVRSDGKTAFTFLIDYNGSFVPNAGANWVAIGY